MSCIQFGTLSRPGLSHQKIGSPGLEQARTLAFPPRPFLPPSLKPVRSPRGIRNTKVTIPILGVAAHARNEAAGSEDQIADGAVELRRGGRGRERQRHAQAGADVRDPQATGRRAMSRSSAPAWSRCCRTASASCARPTPTTSPAPTTSTSRPRRSGASRLRTGDTVEGQIRSPKEGERYFALLKVNTINFEDPEKQRHKVHFDNLTPLYPDEWLKMEIEDPTGKDNTRPRVIDIVVADRQGPARPDRGAAAHRQDGAPAEHRPRRSPPTIPSAT